MAVFDLRDEDKHADCAVHILVFVVVQLDEGRGGGGRGKAVGAGVWLAD